MKIITWNVNGIRAVLKKGFKDFLANKKPDIICLQETKAFESQFLAEIGELEGYKYVWHSGTRPGYAGSAILYKENLAVSDLKNHFWEIEHFHADGRVTELKCDNFILINSYFPNGGQKVSEENMLDYKLEFYDKMIHYVNTLVASWNNVIMTWDFNICHTEIDIARPKENEDSIGFLPIERKKIDHFLELGYIDTFRHFYPEKRDIYSWWSYRAGARPRNVGWRLDYFIVNQSFIENVKDTIYLADVMGSDHCPVEIILK